MLNDFHHHSLQTSTSTLSSSSSSSSQIRNNTTKWDSDCDWDLSLTCIVIGIKALLVTVTVTMYTIFELGVSSAPVHRGSIKSETIVENWWQNACGSNMKIRHRSHTNPTSNHSSIKLYVKQLNLMVKKIDVILDDQLAPLYEKVLHLDMNTISPDRGIRSVPDNQAHKIDLAYNKFYEDLKKQAVALYEISQFKLRRHSSNFDMGKRLRILHSFSREIKSLMCELELELNQKHHRTWPVRSLDSIRQRNQQSLVIDLTNQMINDWKYFQQFYTFIKNWSREFNQFVPRKGKRTTQPPLKL